MATAVYRLNEEKERAPCLSGSGGDASDGGDSGAAMLGGAGRRRVALDVLFACWGLGTWLGVNGLFVQLPLLVQRLPEGWGLAASMALAVQAANAGLALYALLRRVRPRAPDAPYIYALLAVGAGALLANAFLFDRRTELAGRDRSLAFLALTFCAALVGCTSSVLFYPYLRHFRDVYLATYFVGEGLSGFVPSVLALAQGVGGEPACGPRGAEYPPPRFSTTVFLLALGALAAVSLLAFAVIDRSGAFASERVAPAAAAKDAEAHDPRESLLRGRWLGVLALMVVLNALSNGVLPSVQSFSCMPYGTRAYHLAASLGAMANPAACLAGVWLRPAPPRALAALLAVSAAPLAYILATALLSPAPPLVGRGALGVGVVVAAWVWVVGAVSYTRMWVCGWARAGGARGMRAVGVSTQLGSAAGSLLLFALVNYTALFTQTVPCSHTNTNTTTTPPSIRAL